MASEKREQTFQDWLNTNGWGGGPPAFYQCSWWLERVREYDAERSVAQPTDKMRELNEECATLRKDCIALNARVKELESQPTAMPPQPEYLVGTCEKDQKLHVEDDTCIDWQVEPSAVDAALRDCCACRRFGSPPEGYPPCPCHCHKKSDLAQFIAKELFDSGPQAILAIAAMIRPILAKYEASQMDRLPCGCKGKRCCYE